MDISKLIQGISITRGAAALILLAAILGLILIPWEGREDLDKYKDMFARGEYEVCSSELAKIVERNPDWHEARDLLLQVQLVTGQKEALENLMYLLEAEYETSQENIALNWLSVADPGTVAQARSRLEDMVENQPDLHKTRAFLIRLETAANNPTGALTHLIQLARRGQSSRVLEMEVVGICEDYQYSISILDKSLAADPDFHWAKEMQILIALWNQDYDYSTSQIKQMLALGITPPEDLTSLVISLLLSHREFVEALDFAMLLGKDDWVQEVLTQAETTTEPRVVQQISELMERLPDEPRLQVLQAFYTQPPREALTQLLDLESSGYVPLDRLRYAERKLALLKDAELIGPEYLKFLDDIPEDVLDLAIQYRETYPQGLAYIINVLEQDYPDCAEGLNLLREIAAYTGEVPEVIWASSIKGAVDLALSPNGKWLAVSASSKSLFVNLEIGSDRYFSPQAADWAWSPDSRHAVGRIADVPDCQLLYVTVVRDIVQAHDTLLPNEIWTEPEVLGWLDNSCLAIKSQGEAANSSRIAEYNTETGEYRWLGEAREGWPTLTSDRHLAWVRLEARKLTIDTGNVAGEYPISVSYTAINSPLEWFPGDRKLIFSSTIPSSSSGRDYAYILDTDSGSFQRYNLPLAYCPGNWADSENTWGMVSFADLGMGYNALVRENLVESTRQYAGITFFGVEEAVLSAQGKLLAISDADGIKVYKLP